MTNATKPKRQGYSVRWFKDGAWRVFSRHTTKSEAIAEAQRQITWKCFAFAVFCGRWKIDAWLSPDEDDNADASAGNGTPSKPAGPWRSWILCSPVDSRDVFQAVEFSLAAKDAEMVTVKEFRARRLNRSRELSREEARQVWRDARRRGLVQF